VRRAARRGTPRPWLYGMVVMGLEQVVMGLKLVGACTSSLQHTKSCKPLSKVVAGHVRGCRPPAMQLMIKAAAT
jgi:hypothetical protein